jgi:hypothetical protein
LAVLVALGAGGPSVALAVLAITLRFGLPGATLAARVTAVALRTTRLLREAGRFRVANHSARTLEGASVKPQHVRDVVE